MDPYGSIEADRDKEPEKWNEEWESLLQKKFKPLPSYPDLAPLGEYSAQLLGQGMLASIEEIRKDLCTLQKDLAGLVANKRETDHFDSKWLSMSPETRMEYALKALVVTSGATPDMEDRRRWCPETSASFWQRDGGKGFLDLLNTTLGTPNGELPSDDLRTNPILVSHPVFDRIWHIGEPCAPGENEAARDVIQMHTSLGRNFYLSLFLWNTVLAAYGMSQNYKASKLPTSFKESMRDVKENFRAEESKKIIKEAKDAYSQADRACANCRKGAFQLPEGGKFLQCSKCTGIGRKVMYCDKDCQLKDWKHGNPPHKKICGKPLDILEAGPTAVPIRSSSPSTIPPPDPGFIRSPELVHQLSLLEDNPQVSYVLTQPAPKADHGLVLQNAMAKVMFEIMKGRAIKNGDPTSVATMCNMLEDGAAGVGISKARLMVQLGKEYGIPVAQLTELCRKTAERNDIEQRTKEIDRLAAQLDASLDLPD